MTSRHATSLTDGEIVEENDLGSNPVDEFAMGER
jgi:hypothetical protein